LTMFFLAGAALPFTKHLWHFEQDEESVRLER
jgi:hypothetical protein